jgi:hypothetical protein
LRLCLTQPTSKVATPTRPTGKVAIPHSIPKFINPQSKTRLLQITSEPHPFFPTLKRLRTEPYGVGCLKG